jgi:hypothetical protein
MENEDYFPSNTVARCATYRSNRDYQSEGSLLSITQMSRHFCIRPGEIALATQSRANAINDKPTSLPRGVWQREVVETDIARSTSRPVHEWELTAVGPLLH